jgi:hypothetical protein
MAIQSTSGEVLSLMMPCDCTVNSLGLRVGSTVLAGEPVAQLAAPDSRVVVSAMVPADMVFDLSQKNAVELTLQDGVVVMAEPEFAAQPATSDPGGARPLTLIPTTTLPANRIGEPVQIRIIQTTGWLGTGLSKLRNLFFVAAKGE